MGPAGMRGSGGRPRVVRFGVLRAIRRILERSASSDRRSRSGGSYFQNHTWVPFVVGLRNHVRTDRIKYLRIAMGARARDESEMFVVEREVDGCVRPLGVRGG